MFGISYEVAIRILYFIIRKQQTDRDTYYIFLIETINRTFTCIKKAWRYQIETWFANVWFPQEKNIVKLPPVLPLLLWSYSTLS